MEEKTRLKKYKREKGAFRLMQIQPRDIEILRSVADYRFLTTDQIIALHGGDEGRGERNIKLRLQKLYHNGFIDRLGQNLSYTKPQGHMVYGLANKGANLLDEQFEDFERTKVDWLTKNKEMAGRNVSHRLMISNFRSVLTLALRNHDQASLFRWWEGRELKDHVAVNSKKTAIVPDALFTLEDDQGAFDFFLEADRSTMTTKRMFLKMRAYWEWYHQWDKKDGQLYNPKFDVGPFRVLTLCKSEDRKENLRWIAKGVDPQKIKTGLRMFYFTSEKNLDLSNPLTILSRIWQTPNDESHCLLE